MINLTGYEVLNPIHESNNSLVCRGLRKADNQPVILKFLKQDYPTSASLVRYKQEYEITRTLNLDSVPKVYSLEKYQNTLVIVFEDCHGESLKRWLDGKNLSLERFLSIAIKITKALGEIHHRNIIHKDFNPSNIIINPDLCLVQVIDFGISTVLTHENPTIKNPNVLEGTLTHISPEQTGRMNREIDYRTDFYSLGVTFYELLTGQLPFNSSDRMELVHCHIAKEAVPPHKINSEIPKVVSDIVMKLLAKTAEGRYQSAWGISADLEECLEQLQTKGRIADFSIAQNDITDKFQIPQKLYGREQEVETLLAAFDRVSNGTKEIMLVAGYSGIGKSALVQEVYKPITKARGYFIAGKFDQFQRNIPYSAIINAFKSLVKQLLSENEVQLAEWKEKLLAVLGTNGQVIIDVVPEIELIIGKQPAVSELAPTESQNRFNSVFQNFIRVFCSQEHPLVIFLDDLQWADSATLKLLEVMMTDAETRYFFLIGAYRDNEVDSGHPLMMTLDFLHSKGMIVNYITLVPLALEHINNLIADTLHSQPLAIKSLGELVIRKTDGNPFFVNQFLKTLYQENLLTFNQPSQRSKDFWHWDISNIEAMDITDNVVELMVRKLRKLPDYTQQVLQLAACVGNTFDLHTICIIHEASATIAYHDLLPAIQEGLILPISELEVTPDEIIDAHLIILSFKFLHDRVQQAAYAMIPEDQKKEVHLKIGQLLLKNIPEEEVEENIFDLVNHLNTGVELIDDSNQQAKLAKLNLIAGKKAKASTAYKTAVTYFALGRKLLGISAWKFYYELTFTLHKEQSECEYLIGNFEQAESLFNTALKNSNSEIDKAEIYSLYTFFCATLSRKNEAIKFAIAGLECLGVDLPQTEKELPKAVEAELQQVSLNLSQRNVADLINSPEIKDLKKKISMKLLIDLWASAYYITNQNWLDLSILKIVNMSLRYGNTDQSAFGYATYGMMLSSQEQYKSAYEFGKLALSLNQKFNNKSLSCKVPNIFALAVNPYNNHFRTNLDVFRQSYQGGLECGDLVYIVWTIMFSTWTRFIMGQPLKEIYEESQKYLTVFKQTNDLSMLYIFMFLQRLTLNLQGLTKDKYNFDDETFSEALSLQHWENTKFYHVTTWHGMFKSQVLFFYEDYTEALQFAQESDRTIATSFVFFNIIQHYFYYALIVAALYPSATANEQENYWRVLETSLKKMKTWADNCPENYLHQYLLIAAEIARISGKDLEAMDLYDKAIASAKENDFIQNEALSNELAAKFWLCRGKEEIAQLYMQKAYYGYQLWGAQRKVDDLEQKYPQLVTFVSVKATSRTTDNRTTSVSTSTSTNLGSTLDLATVMKAAQVISGEIVLSKLLTRLMKIAIENAGAEKGFLILERAGNWVIEAEGSVKGDEVSVLQSLPLNETAASGDTPKLADAIANYVVRTQENVVLNNAAREGQFTRDPYVVATQPKSLLCTPLLHQGKLTGILYLENNLTEGAFTTDRLELLKLLSGQIAISIENAHLYKNLQEFNQNLEQLVSERTQELYDTLEHLKAAQSKLVEAEKMASLGGLVAGVAHEINTPIGVGVTVASALAEHTTEFASIYKSGKMKRSELEEFLDIATQSSNTLLINLERAAALIQSFKQVAVDQSSEERRTFQLKAYLDEILLQLKPKLRNTKHLIEISGNNRISLDSYPGAFSQIVTNLLINSLTHAYEGDAVGKILIHFQQEGEQLILEYSDDGRGIPAENLGKIYEPFFTTKRSQGGSGLGLHLVYNLVTQKLKGEIECRSEVGKGTQFVIKLPMQIDCKQSFGYED